MFRLFIVGAVLWLCGVSFLIAVAGHHVAAHWFTFAYLTAIVVALPFGWRWLKQYKLTASIAARVDAAETNIWKRIMLHLEGGKSAFLMALVSAFATAKDWLGTSLHAVLGLAPDDLDPLKDTTLLHTFFSDGVALKAIASITIFSAFLTIKGHLFAAKIVPAPGTAAPLSVAPTEAAAPAS